MRVLIRTEADRAKALAHMQALKLGAGAWVYDVKRFAPQRSVRQNKLAHMWFALIAQETGNDAETIKEYLKGKFLGTRSATIGRDTVAVVPHTSDLDTRQMTVFLDNVRMWAMDELGCVLPVPDDLGWDDFVLRYGGE